MFKPIVPTDLTFEQLNLNSFIGDANLQKRSEASDKVKKSSESFTGKNISEIESEIVDLRIASQIETLGQLEERISSIQVSIDKSISDNGGLSVPVNVKGRPSLKRAISRVFGIKTSEISYDMYRSALTALQELQIDAADDLMENS